MPRSPRRAASVLAAALAGTVIGAAPLLPASAATTTTWSTAVANGTYEVTVKHPDAQPTPGFYRIDAEGKTVKNVDLAWDTTFTTTVTDGRLDLTLVGPSQLQGLKVYPVRTGDAGGSTTPPPPTTPTPPPPTPPTPPATGGSAAQRLWPGSAAGRPASGGRTPGYQSLQELQKWGSWRGRPSETALTYGMQDGYGNLAGNSWPVSAWDGFQGHIVYSLPILPSDGSSSLTRVADGWHDWAFASVARQLRDHGRGDSVVRVGWEYNIPEMPWYTTTANVGEWKRAFRRVVQVMRAEAPGLKFEFGVNCGSRLNGSTDRLAPLTQGYPGDDVVDLVGCDVYDWWQTRGSNPTEWAASLRPAATPGIADVVDFARAHGKLASFAEWGLATGDPAGGGDDTYWIQQMHDFFVANADVVALESYFEQPVQMGNALSLGQAPNAAQTYRRLFGG